MGDQGIDFISKFVVIAAGLFEEVGPCRSRSINRFTEDLFSMLVQIGDRSAPLQFVGERAERIFPGVGMYVNIKPTGFAGKGVSGLQIGIG